MNAAANEIVKLRSLAQREKRGPAALCAEELRIREKFGLVEDTRLHDVNQTRQPAAISCGAPRAALLNRSARSASRTSIFDRYGALRQGRDGSLDRPIDPTASMVSASLGSSFRYRYVEKGWVMEVLG